MAEIDEILKRYTDPVTGSFHGVSFVAIDSKGKRIFPSSSLCLPRHSPKPSQGDMFN